MSLLKALKTDDSIAKEKDTLGGMNLFDTDIYPMTVAMAYIQPADSGALGLFVTFKDENGRKLEMRQYMTSGTAKGSKNYYEKDDGKGGKEKHYLPGFLIANSLSELTTGVEISEHDTEEKVVNVYSSTAKAEVPTKVQAVVALIGQTINVGVERQLVTKQIKADDGSYVDDPNGGTRETNEVTKLFCAKDKFANMTSAEIRAGATEATFAGKWLEKNKGKVIDRTGSKKSGATAGAPAAKSGVTTGKPANSLFG